ncbi:MAG: response regulator [Anaerolineae bacterium]|nr:response regulator [Anaerolineae bacterium]
MTRIMLVDDDRTTVKLLQTLLELDGYEVSTVPRGLDVLSKMEQTCPDIVLMDYHLSDVEGDKVVRDLRRVPAFAQIPVVITSGMDVEREAMQAGASSFLLKPFEPEELPELFTRLLTTKPS